MKKRDEGYKDPDAIDWTQVVSKIAHERDEIAFGQFFDYFAPKIKAFSHAKQPGADLVADDLVQEVMIKVWNKCHTYKPELASVSTWLFTMTRNCRIDQIRKAKAHINLTVDDLWYEDDSEPDPFGAVQQHRIDMNIHLSLKELPSEQQQVLTKVYLQGKTQQQTAHELKLPLGTVKSRVRLALKKLETMMRSA
ncbi:MAG: sigma-70 family RNA polymerase sigma factor [Cellvibrionaceae bacterium]